MKKNKILRQLKYRSDVRICAPLDYMRLVNHLGENAEYVLIEDQIKAIKHKGLFFIPSEDKDLQNCYYDPNRAILQ